jgi:subtilisin family serine protease
MKLSPFILFCAFISMTGQTEMKERFYFQLNIKNGNELLVSKNTSGNFTVVNAEDAEETKIYGSYTIFNFEKAFKNSSREKLAHVYNIETDDVGLISNLKHSFPEKYTRIDQFYPNEKPYYPNDYGETSPVENLGAKVRADDLDLLEMPKAWGITKGSKKVVIGISDARIDSTDAEFKGRVSNYLKYFNSKGYGCNHGSNVAAIAGARDNNAYGLTGVCPDCDMIAHGYGNFKYIEELVAAGARVINTSWVLCNMGAYHENIEERIDEFYEDGIIIVAAAGNGKNCNNDGYNQDDYGYPAAYEKVIAVTGIFVTEELDKATPIIDKNNKRIYKYIRDRHPNKLNYNKDGELVASYYPWLLQSHNAIDICAPAYSYLHGNYLCNEGEIIMGGVTSGAAPFISGVLGLIFSENYCLSAYEAETILKLSSEEIENLEGNRQFIGRLGAGRVNAYRAVKMARETKELFGNVEVSNRDMYRYHYRLENAPYSITLQNQTFRDSASVRFKARNAIYLKPGTHLKPDKTSTMTFKIDPTTPTEECFPAPPKAYESIYTKK